MTARFEFGAEQQAVIVVDRCRLSVRFSRLLLRPAALHVHFGSVALPSPPVTTFVLTTVHLPTIPLLAALAVHFGALLLVAEVQRRMLLLLPVAVHFARLLLAAVHFGALLFCFFIDMV